MTTSDNHPKVELLAPAGNMEKLEIALHYGADAVYLAGKSYSLRNFSGNFSSSQLRQAVDTAHRSGARVYVACNIYPRNHELDGIGFFLDELSGMDIDAVIVADPGVVGLARQRMPHIPIHLSTQANTTNIQSVLFWQRLGVKRINIARELSLAEVGQIASASPVQIEAFVHGAMCIAYSGRCLLSSFLADRDSNRGCCSHPCRWKYALVEEKRPGQPLPLEEDQRGSYILNSKDLCMIDHIADLIQAGIRSLKIEGRMKGIHYLATTVKTYREAIDAYYAGPADYTIEPAWRRELEQVNNRGYCTGFYFGHPDQIAPDTSKSAGSAGSQFVARVIAASQGTATRIWVRNKISTGDSVQVFSRCGPSRGDRVLAINAEDGTFQPVAQPGQIVNIDLNHACQINDLIRKLPESSVGGQTSYGA